MDFNEEGGIGSGIACSEIDGVSFANSGPLTDTRGAEVIFSLLKADNGAKRAEKSSDSNFLWYRKFFCQWQAL